MCGRFTIAVVIGLYERFQVPDPGVPLVPRYNIAPSQDVPVVVHSAGNGQDNTLVTMRWGLVPSWSRDPGQSPHPINARADSLGSKPMFCHLVKDNRCLVPATGFYEWQKAGRTKVPYYVRMKDASLFAFAGLHDRWRGPDGTELSTFAIVTTEPNELVRPLHDRMPAILKREDEAFWLDPGNEDAALLTSILQPYPPDEMVTYPVSTAVNSPDNEGASLIRPKESLLGW